MSETTEDFTLDNPESWPTDLVGLAGLADGEPGEAKVVKDTEPPAARDQKVAADLNTDKGPDPQGVLTRDGKHVIPYEVLRSERDARKHLETQTATLQAEVTALKAAKAAPAAEGTDRPAAAAADQELPAETKAKVDQMREDYGDDIADQWLDTFRVKNDLAGIKRSLQATESEREAVESAHRQTEQESIQQAIDAAPLLAEWQADSANPEWYQRANELHQVLMKSNPAYREMSWAKRMEELPAKVETVYGESPQSATRKVAITTGKSAARAVASATVRRPASMSDIPGGEPPAQSETERLETMTPAQMQAYLGRINPDKLESFLRNL